MVSCDAGDAVDERHLGVVLGVVGDGDALVAGQRADDDLGAVLLDERADLLDDAVGGVVTAADADELDVEPADVGAGEAVERGGGRVRRGATVFDHRQRRAGDDVLVEAAERALALAEDAELEGPARFAGRAG